MECKEWRKMPVHVKWLHAGLASQRCLLLFEADEGMVDISSDLFCGMLLLLFCLYICLGKKKILSLSRSPSLSVLMML